MPTYGYTCSKCGYSFDKILKIDDRDNPTKEPCFQCGEIAVNKAFGSNALLDPYRMGIHKPPQGFRDVLKQIHTRNYGSAMNVDS